MPFASPDWRNTQAQDGVGAYITPNNGNPNTAYNNPPSLQYGWSPDSQFGGVYMGGQNANLGRYRPPTLAGEGRDPTNWNDYGGYNYNLPNAYGPFANFMNYGQGTGAPGANPYPWAPVANDVYMQGPRPGGGNSSRGTANSMADLGGQLVNYYRQRLGMDQQQAGSRWGVPNTQESYDAIQRAMEFFQQNQGNNAQPTGSWGARGPSGGSTELTIGGSNVPISGTVPAPQWGAAGMERFRQWAGSAPDAQQPQSSEAPPSLSTVAPTASSPAPRFNPYRREHGYRSGNPGLGVYRR